MESPPTDSPDFILDGNPGNPSRDELAHPIIAGGRLYLREQDKLMCYELRKES